MILARFTKVLFMADSGKNEHAYIKDLDTIQPTLEIEVFNDSVRVMHLFDVLTFKGCEWSQKHSFRRLNRSD